MNHLFEIIVIAIVLTLSFRRAVFLFASMLPMRSLPPPQALPRVTVLVPAWNESMMAGRLLAALGKLSYPADRLYFVLICDGSTDATPVLFREWAVGRFNTLVIESPCREGKAAALNAGLRLVNTEIVVTLDADLEPEAEFLRELVRPFADPTVGAAAAFLKPINMEANVVTRYASITTWVHQLVTSAGTDRLGLNPPTFGAAAYRKAALEQIGGFPLVPLGEDVATSTRLIHRGWRTRFVVTAIADNTVASGIKAYWHQHVRWARATFGISVKPGQQSRASWLQRAEMGATSIGYADRAVFALAVAGAVFGTLPAWVPLLYLTVPGAEILVALFKAGVRGALPWFLFTTLPFFVIDLAGSVVALAAQLTRRPYRWDSSRTLPGHRDTYRDG